jgi:hypothetical protein
MSPADVTAHSNRKVWWKCKFGHSFQASIANRANGRGCTNCRYVEPGVNDLASQNPEILKQWDYSKNKLLPEFVSVATGEKFWWICDKKHSWQSSPANRKYGRGCPTCAETGFKPHLPALLYLLEHEQLKSFKFGITNIGTTRLAKFINAGWKVHATISHSDGALIYALEQQLLQWIRTELKFPSHLTKLEMKSTGGFTETFTNQALGKVELTDAAYKMLNELG